MRSVGRVRGDCARGGCHAERAHGALRVRETRLRPRDPGVRGPAAPVPGRPGRRPRDRALGHGERRVLVPGGRLRRGARRRAGHRSRP